MITTLKNRRGRKNKFQMIYHSENGSVTLSNVVITKDVSEPRFVRDIPARIIRQNVV